MARRLCILITSILTILLYTFITNGCSGNKQSTNTTCEEKALDYWIKGITASKDSIKEVIRLSDSTYACLAEVENEGLCYYIYTTKLDNKYCKGFGVFFPTSGTLGNFLELKDDNGDILDKDKNPEAWNKKVDETIICILTKMVDEDWAYISKE